MAVQYAVKLIPAGKNWRGKQLWIGQIWKRRDEETEWSQVYNDPEHKQWPVQRRAVTVKTDKIIDWARAWLEEEKRVEELTQLIPIGLWDK